MKETETEKPIYLIHAEDWLNRNKYVFRKMSLLLTITLCIDAFIIFSGILDFFIGLVPPIFSGQTALFYALAPSILVCFAILYFYKTFGTEAFVYYFNKIRILPFQSKEEINVITAIFNIWTLKTFVIFAINLFVASAGSHALVEVSVEKPKTENIAEQTLAISQQTQNQINQLKDKFESKFDSERKAIENEFEFKTKSIEKSLNNTWDSKKRKTLNEKLVSLNNELSKKITSFEKKKEKAETELKQEISKLESLGKQVLDSKKKNNANLESAYQEQVDSSSSSLYVLVFVNLMFGLMALRFNGEKVYSKRVVKDSRAENEFEFELKQGVKMPDALREKIVSLKGDKSIRDLQKFLTQNKIVESISTGTLSDIFKGKEKELPAAKDETNENKYI